jgi:zinc-ribbon domain
VTCPKCQANVPDESLFCLRCGAGLRVPAERAPLNGGGTAPQPRAAAGAKPAAMAQPKTPPRPEAPPGTKQPYTLAFKALADERLRYRVARWLCEVAPAHPLSEVQAGLTQGEFATFLALTHEEAEAARQRIQALGAHPALWRLHPASPAEMLIPERPVRKAKAASAANPRKRIAIVAAVLVAILVAVGILAERLSSSLAPPEQRTAPRTGTQ